MAQEINVELFEKNAKIYNKKGLRRAYFSIPKREEEYINLRPLGATSKFVLEVIIDKEIVGEYQEYLKQKGYTILGSSNTYFIENMISDYKNKLSLYSNIKEQMEAIEKDYNLMLEKNKAYEELENDDVKFYFLPYNDNISNLCEFIEEEKQEILKFSKDKDVTIVMNILAYCNTIKGYFGFNFLDADTKEEVNVDYSSNIIVNVNFAQKMSVYAAALLLTGITENGEDLELMSCHIMADNLKFIK